MPAPQLPPDPGPAPAPAPGVVRVDAPAAAVVFPETKLDGSPSYDLRADIGDWGVTAEGPAPDGWQLTVMASEPIAADTGLPLLGSVMRMRVPTPEGGGAPPSVVTGDEHGFVALNGDEARQGAVIAKSGPSTAAGAWAMREPGTSDLELSMPYDTRSVRYDSAITFTISPGL